MSMYETGTVSAAAEATTITGSGTKWADQRNGIGPQCTIAIYGAGTVDLYAIARVDSDTQLTVTRPVSKAFSGSAYGVMVAETQSVQYWSNMLASQLGYYQSQMDDWQEIMTGDGSVTVTAPDGREVTISSFKKLTDDMAGKAGLVDGAVPVAQGGTGAKTAADARTNLGLGNSATRNIGTTSGTVAAGNDSRLNTLSGKTGGDVSSTIRVTAGGVCANVKNGGANTGAAMWSGQLVSSIPGWGVPDSTPAGATGGYVSLNILTTNGGNTANALLEANTSWWGVKRWQFDMNSGNATAPGNWVGSSDRRLKTDIQEIANPLDKMRSFRGVSWSRLDGIAPGRGFIAQDVQKVFPDAVFEGIDVELEDGTIIERALSVDTTGVAAALHHEAILVLMDKINEMQDEMSGLKQKISELCGGATS